MPDIHPVDLHVGACIRKFRQEKGLTQVELADMIGLTFQQLQKYEWGTNRVSASKLHALSRAFGVEISRFFEGLPEEATEERPHLKDKASAFLRTEEGQVLARYFLDLTPAKRRGVTALVRHLISDETVV